MLQITEINVFYPSTAHYFGNYLPKFAEEINKIKEDGKY